MTKKQKKNLIRIIIASVLMVAFIFIPVSGLYKLALYLIPYLIIGYDILIKAFKGIINLQPFDECLLMSLATIGAIVIAIIEDGDYLEAIAVMLFYQIGEWFQSYAVGKSRKNISTLMDIRPDYANVEIDGKIVKVDPDDVEVDTIITVLPGEKIPIDGIVEEGNSTLDTVALTGESVPRSVSKGDEVISGCVNLNGLLKIRTTKEFENSTASKILDLVENASSKKSRSENFITKFAKIYTPAVIFSAIALAILPPLFNMFILIQPADWTNWIYRALTFLVISCPCALVISIPLSFFAGIGGASKEGILIKGSNYLETLSKAHTVVFDKTGTLTKGVFEVTGVYPNEGIEKSELLSLAASVEHYSMHPIAFSVKKAAAEFSGKVIPDNTEEIAGHGIKAKIGNETVYVGNSKLMDSIGAEYTIPETVGTVVYIAKGNRFMGSIVISDVIKANSKNAVSGLKKSGIRKTVMLTGDNKAVAEEIAKELGIDEVHSNLLPADKVDMIEKLISEKNGNEAIVFVGDGINDAPVLSRADIGIAMGAIGSDAAIEASDIVLMDDDPMKISKAIKISIKCLTIVKENIWFAIGVKIICLVLGALGYANMWTAIFADVGVMVLVVLNAIRALLIKKL